MKLKQQITLLTSLSLLVPAVLISSISIYKIKSKAEVDIEEFRADETQNLKLYLKHITDIAYGMIEVKYNEAQKFDSLPVRDSVMQQCLAELSKLRFDRGEGYFWVTNNTLPFPTMLMHAEKVKLKGVVLDDASYNVEKDKLRNIYQVRAERCNASGEAYVEYIMKKPGTTEVANKISYSRLFAGNGWIVSAGFYIDQIEAGVALKRDALSKQLNETVFSILAISVLVLGTGLFISLHFSGKLSKALLIIKDKLKSLGLGEQVEEMEVNRNDEVGEMTGSLNTLVRGLRSYTAFAKDIGEGNLSKEFSPLSVEDVLGNQLIEMRGNLKQASDEKSIRDWFNEGLAKLGEVLRRNNSDTKDLSEEILKSVIQYLNVNQGSLFLTVEAPDGTKELNQVATYAYDRKKHMKRTIAFGEGLVGQAAIEGATVLLHEVPQNYITITSGLGQALPETIIIVPLMHNDEVFGAIELASFHRLKDHEVKFIEKIAESIASTVSTVQVNEQTRKLLQQSQQMSEELKAQEEELRQNQEELEATQEQMQRKQLELERENEMLKQKRTAGYSLEEVA